MKLRVQTDYALRVLLYLTHVGRRVTAGEIAKTYDISREHLVKVIQSLARLDLVKTTAGRGGGLSLATDPATITVRSVVEAFEGRDGVLECVKHPDSCPMEPGCSLRRLLIEAEERFYQTLGTRTIAELAPPSEQGGLYNLRIP